MTPRPIPLRPDENVVNQRAVASLVRAAIATGISAIDKQTHPQEYAKRVWDDHSVDLVLRAAVTPASLAGNAALARVSAAFLKTLVPVSAGADLLDRGVQLNFAGAAQINVPAIAVPTATFIAEGAPIPVQRNRPLRRRR